ncbi:PASTA domain-containing protein [Bacteroidia bacterium]|nr:PASTA domain-containing protein [Bacteroidia bacterium]
MKLFANIYIKNIGIAIVILIVLIFIVLQWLNVYTHHGKQVTVPDVKGLQVEQAAPFLEQKSLHYVVVDSIYAKNQAPGSILETVPPIGTNVKEGRTIYLTVNADTAQLLTVPAVMDMSQRQASAMLLSLGFESVQIRTVSGAYKDLVVGLETASGQTVEAGSRIPANTTLNLLVSSGEADISLPDSAEVITEDSEESWY